MFWFVLSMAWRDARAEGRRMLLFALALALGVGGLVAVKSFSHSLRQQMRAESRSLMAADVALVSARPFIQGELDALERLKSRGAQVVISREFLSNAVADQGPKTGQPQAVQVRAVGAGYPFYGQVKTLSGRPLAQLMGPGQALVQESLLLRLKLKVGDRIRLGRARLVISDVLVREPDSIQMFAMMPRVLLGAQAGEATGLISHQGLVTHRALVRLPPGSDSAQEARDLKDSLPDRYADVRGADNANPQVTRFMEHLTRFLNLLGLVALVLAAVGVSVSIRVFLRRKLDSIATLKCLGAGSRLVLAVYLSQALLLGLAGSGAGVVLGAALHGWLPGLLAGFLPEGLVFSFSPWAALEGMALGLLITAAFALPPILEAREVPPARVFRRQVEEPLPPGVRRRRALLTAAGMLPLLAGLSLWEADNFKIGAIFFAGLTGSVAALYAAAWGVVAGLGKAPRPRSFVLRQGLAALHRPGNQTLTVVVSLGMGVVLAVAVFLVRGDLYRQIQSGGGAATPNLFFVNIQPQDRAVFQGAIRSTGFAPPDLVPVIQGRIHALNGQRVRLDQVTDEEKKNVLGFEYRVTYRDHLEPGEEILDGSFPGRVSGPQVSVAEWWAKATGLGVGDTLSMDIQGMPVSAVITSIRRPDWNSQRVNFTMVYLPGLLEDAPQQFISSMRVETPEDRVRVQEAVAAGLPSVTSLDGQSVIDTVVRVMDRIALAIQFMAAFTMAVAVVILVGALSSTRFQRLRETALLKTLGAAPRRVAGVLAAEYAVLGAVAGGVGALASGMLAWALVTYGFQGKSSFSLLPLLAGWAAALAATVLVGLAVSVDILFKKPLPVLREE
ncbi:MAG: ABC transporter permease [Deltaproteobacteria bacterium]|nr:ABC transporter permease [Deltaproteobacteria bacterium]MDH4121988.1 ABC transporter permease [Deltaproteobacteria bacterium]